ncbi:hypothetical protein AWB78_04298 [Caballeronia calidae]|uniref:Uncharacterized protein n=1 Tax=Caballeronia calidae TaxID=1777139 RepID=A0A158CT79_9BURK|nr:hypothetical protein AWB78_04298 [Caballeronia calidae]
MPKSSSETVTSSLRTAESARDAAAKSLMTAVSVTSMSSTEAHTPDAKAPSETSAARSQFWIVVGDRPVAS